MVVQEESGSDVEGYEDIDGVVFMCSQDEEDAEEIEDPGQCVNEVPAPGSVCGGEAVLNLNLNLNLHVHYNIQKYSIFLCEIIFLSS